jgi:hypothetical protein
VAFLALPSERKGDLILFTPASEMRDGGKTRGMAEVQPSKPQDGLSPAASQRSSPRTRKIATGHTTVPLSEELTIFLAGPSDFKIHTDLSAVLSSLSVSTVYELALLDQSGRDQVHAALTKKPEQRRWKKHADAKLNPLMSGYEEAMQHLGQQMKSANTIEELVQVGCTPEIATAALAWFQENGYEEMEDLVEVEKEEVKEFVEAMVAVGGRGVEIQRRATMVVRAAKEKVEIEKAAREKAAREKAARDKASAAGFVVGTAVCGLFGATVYDGKVTSITAVEGIVVTFSGGDVKNYTPSELKSCVQNALDRKSVV